MNLFFDLDGTLTDPFEGITRSILFALQALSLPLPPADDLRWCIGPPLLDSFAALGADDPDKALNLYRSRYTRVGLYENSVYPGVITTLRQLTSTGNRLFLMTAKPHEYARIITQHFGIAPFLAEEFGPELDGTRNDKADLLAYALERTGSQADASVMIGDRRHDHIAAKANGVASVAALWGYGTPEEHVLATATCADIADLPAVLALL